jgi:hypothetical protein
MPPTLFSVWQLMRRANFLVRSLKATAFRYCVATGKESLWWNKVLEKPNKLAAQRRDEVSRVG